ncbi:MAG: hypothetical protein GY731_01705 [Gammaproteobacteria bacterium]|nr:hypothetical protein [Gammaproteobacteria bacterium]
MFTKNITAPCLMVILLLVPLGEAMARIKLITLPVRERVEIQLDNPHATLVEEERLVPLLEGTNQVDFSWANTSIQPDSIVFRVVSSDHPVNVLSVSYPPNENALVWSVAAGGSGPARIRISYLIGNLERSFTYRALASHDEKSLRLNQYLRLKNLANEEFGDSGLWVGFGKRLKKPIGLNETKEILVGGYRDVPIRKTYTGNVAEMGYLDAAQHKLNIPMHYVLKNDGANHMGQAALTYGKVRIFQDDGRGSSAFIGEDWGKFTPIDEEMSLYLGLARDVVVKRTIEKNRRHRVTGNLYHHEVVVKYEIENFKDSPLTLDVVEDLRHLRGEVHQDTGRPVEWQLGKKTTLEVGPLPDRTTADKAVFQTMLPPRAGSGKPEKLVRRFHVHLKNEW